MLTDMVPTTETVWLEFHANLLRFVASRVRNPADAEDVVQHVFLQVHRALPTLRDVDRLPAWLYQMTRRVIIDFYRKPAHRREQALDDDVELADEVPEEPTALAELSTCLGPLMATLSTADQETLALIEFQGVSQVDAARQLGVSVSGMKSRVQRARTRLRSAVETCCRIELDRRGGLAAYQPRDCDSGGCD